MSDNKLQVIIQKSGLSEIQAKPLLDSFGDLFVQAHKLKAQADGIKVVSEDDVDGMKKARELRLQTAKVRQEADRKRKELKEPYLRGANAAQAIFNDIRDITKPVEEYLEKQEKFAEIKKQLLLEKRYSDRVEELSTYVDDISVFSLKEMSDEGFGKLLESSKQAYFARLEAEKKAQEEKLKEEKKESLLSERAVKIAPYTRFYPDGFILTKEITQEEFDNAFNHAKNAFNKYEEEQEKIRKENEILRKKQMEEQKKREAIEEKLRAEKEEQDKKERKAREEEARIKAEQDEKERQAILAPDKVKLTGHADNLDEFIRAYSPALQSESAQKVLIEANQLLNWASQLLREGAKKL